MRPTAAVLSRNSFRRPVVVTVYVLVPVAVAIEMTGGGVVFVL